jgi:hypothetical protein
MLSLLPKNYELGLPPIFNAADYADTYSLEGAFKMIQTLQLQVSIILGTISNMSYDGFNAITSFIDYVYAMGFATDGSLAVSQNASISGTLNAIQINNVNMISTSISSTAIVANTIQCNSLTYQNDIGVYINLLVQIPNFGQQTSTSFLQFPLMKSQLITTLVATPSNPFYCSLTIKPNYTVRIIDSNFNILVSISNVGTDIMYNSAYTINATPYKILIFSNGIPL